jgi:MFS family permease
MLPELRATFDVAEPRIGASLTAYFVPFALLLLVSGTLGERWGRRRTVRTAYLAYCAASLVCALAPSFGVFLVGRAAQGLANAFTTPLLLAGLAELSPPERVGRAVGIYASFQAAGQSLSPLVGGLAAEVDWRWAFVGVAGAGLALSLAPPPGDRRTGASARPPIRPLLTPRMGLLAVSAAAGSLGSIGISFLVSLWARDRFDLGPSQAGLVLISFGVAGLALGQLWGRVTDRFGARACGVVAAALGSLLVAGLGQARSVAALVVLWTLAGVVGSLLSVALQGLATGAVPANRGGAVSTTLAFRFGGAALAPQVWLPLYHRTPSAAFAGAGTATLLAGLALAPLGRWVRGPAPGWGGPLGGAAATAAAARAAGAPGGRSAGA